MKRFVLYALVFALLAGSTWVVREPIIEYFEPTGVVHTVTLEENGFVPHTLTVNVGDTVTWNTARGRDFWPASNQHPAHTMYPEFDPDEPIKANRTWSFTFPEAGSWPYHDHLHSFYTGKIIVIDPTPETP